MTSKVAVINPDGRILGVWPITAHDLNCAATNEELCREAVQCAIEDGFAGEDDRQRLRARVLS